MKLKLRKHEQSTGLLQLFRKPQVVPLLLSNSLNPSRPSTPPVLICAHDQLLEPVRYLDTVARYRRLLDTVARAPKESVPAGMGLASRV